MANATKNEIAGLITSVFGFTLAAVIAIIAINEKDNDLKTAFIVLSIAAAVTAIICTCNIAWIIYLSRKRNEPIVMRMVSGPVPENKREENTEITYKDPPADILKERDHKL